MIDPQVEQLANELNEHVKNLNDVWLKLQDHNVSASIVVEGGYTKDSVQTLKVCNIKQTVNYLNTSSEWLTIK